MEWNAKLRLCTSWGDRGPHGRIEDRPISDVKTGTRRMSALGQKRTSRRVRIMSVIPLKAAIHQCGLHVRLVPKATSRKEAVVFLLQFQPTRGVPTPLPS